MEHGDLKGTEWLWNPFMRLPYLDHSGCWQLHTNPDAVSLDGGKSYFLLSERPLYKTHGPVYEGEPRDEHRQGNTVQRQRAGGPALGGRRPRA